MWVIGTEVSVSDGVQILLLVGALVSALIAALTLRHQREVSKIERSLALIGRWHDPALAEYVRRAHVFIADPPPRSEIDPYEPAFLMPLLFLTELALSIQSRLVEEEILFDYFRPAILNDYPKVIWWICQYRSLTRSDERFAAIDALRQKWANRLEREQELIGRGADSKERQRELNEIAWPDRHDVANPCLEPSPRQDEPASRGEDGQ